MYRLLLFVCLSGFGAIAAGAQSPRWEVVSIEQGLSQGFIWGSCQDRDGFLWFCTKNGLNRYDGYEFVAFKNDAYDPYSLSDNQVLDVCDAGEFLCVMAQDQINLFHKRTHRFFRLPGEADIPSRYLGGGCLAENDHTVWLYVILADGKRCYRLTWPPEMPDQLLRDTAAIGRVRARRMFSDLDISSVCISADRKTLWLATNTGKLVRKPLPDGPLSVVQVPISNTRGIGLAPAGNTGVAVGSFKQDTLAWYNPTASAVTPWTIWRSENRGGGVITLDFDDTRKRLWIYIQSELREYDLSRQFEVLDRINARFVMPISGIVQNGLRDQNGLLWFGTDARGIRKFNPGTRLFRHLLENASVYSRPVADRAGNIWLADVRNGAVNRVYDSHNGSSRPYPVTGLNLGLPVQTAGTPDGTIWLCGRQFTGNQPLLVHYDPVSGRQESWPCPKSFEPWQCALFIDRNAGAVWAADRRQMIRFDTRAGHFSAFGFDVPAVNQAANVLALEKTADGSLWIATDAGLVRARPDTNGKYTFQLLKNNPADRNSLLSNSLKSLLCDPTDGMVLWIGTAGNGLCRYDLRKNLFRHYTTRNGLPDDMVYGILAEDPGADGSINLWISTNKGLARFNPRTDNFRYFLVSDGLQDNEFNTYSFGKSPAGELMFGGVNGLTIFNPKALLSSALPAEVRITGLKINNVALSPRDASGILPQSVEFTPQIVLPHDRNNVHIQFMATDLTQPSRNQFRYYLEGAEAAWAHTGFEHSAQYLNLAPGSYAFKVMAANSNGVWSSRVTTLHIRIRPPWYASVWAYIAYVLLFAGGLWYAYRYQLRQKLEHAENERLKELDTFKSRFFTNITHEFRTPLTVILGVTEKLRADRQAPGQPLDMIRRNGESLLRLINQILDLAKLESNKLELRPENGDIIGFVRYVAEAFHSFADTRDLRVQFQANAEAFRMDFDAEKMQSILSNLLSNALKFTPPGGNITVVIQVHADPESAEPTVTISVSDTGVGIPADKIARIFERFYQADNSAARSGEGTGIGLALTRELVRLMQGEISVESRPGQGTTFTLRLPAVSRRETAAAMPSASMVLPTFSPEMSEAPDMPVASGADPDKPLLLIVEDNADVRQYLIDCTQEYYRVSVAHNGRQGIDRAVELAPDLIVSDVMMPEKDGFELCETLKNDPRTSHIPIILLTARVTVEDRIAGLQRGADAYLAKPFHQQELLLHLRNLLHLRTRLQERYATLEPPVPTDDPGLQIEDAFLQKFREFVEAQLGNAQLSVDDLCRAVGMGRTNLHQKITSLTGMSAMQFVRALRLRKAKELLERGDLNVSEVAFEVGFDDPKYFGRVFAEETGVPPTQWRKKG